MDTTSKLLPRLTLIATSAAPWLFAFLLVGCNFQANMENLPALVEKVSKATGFQTEKPQISLEIPRGYAPAKKAASDKSWEQVALDAERMAFQGPAPEAGPVVTAPVAPLAPVPAAKVPQVKVAKGGKKLAKLTIAKKRLAANGRYWKPAKLAGKKVGYHRVTTTKLASTY